jgi:hypothetical protein
MKPQVQHTRKKAFKKFGPLRTIDMDTDSASTESTPREKTTTAKTCRPPPVVLISAIKLIQLHKQLKNVVKEDFEFHNTKNGTRIITREIVNFLEVKSHFERITCPISPSINNPKSP